MNPNQNLKGYRMRDDLLIVHYYLRGLHEKTTRA